VNRLITMVVAIMFAMMFCIAGMSEAQPVDKNLALNSKQQGIISGHYAGSQAVNSRYSVCFLITQNSYKVSLCVPFCKENS